MLKKLAMLSVLLLFAMSMAQAEEGATKFARVHGGVVATTEQIEAGDIYGTFKADVLIKAFKNLYFVGSYQDINNGEVSWEDYKGGICYFTRNPNSPKVQIYFTAAPGLTHTDNGKLGEGSYNGGFGLLVPTSIATFMGEFSMNRVEDKTFLNFSCGIQAAIDL